MTPSVNAREDETDLICAMLGALNDIPLYTTDERARNLLWARVGLRIGAHFANVVAIDDAHDTATRSGEV